MQKPNPEMIALGPKSCTAELLHSNSIIRTADTGKMLLVHKLSRGYIPDVETVHTRLEINSLLWQVKSLEKLSEQVRQPQSLGVCLCCVLCVPCVVCRSLTG